jgi:UDP-glucose 4-epimerase
VRVLVTGGNGFIGRHVVDQLERKGHTPYVFDHRSDGPAVRTFLGDTRDFTSVMEAVAQVDAVIHLAGVLGTQETIKEPIPAVETNIIGGLNVFRAMAHYGRPGAYIAVGNHWMQNSYSITKTTAERFAFMANAEWGTRIAVVRALNAYGPRQKVGPVRKIMPNFIVPTMKGEKIRIYGDGEQIMDMIYVEDVARILIRAALYEHGNYHEAFEAGTGRATTVLDIAHVVIETVHGVTEFDWNDYLEFVPMRPGEPDNSVVVGDPDTLKPLGIQWSDLKSLEDGVEETFKWFRSNSRSNPV